VAPASSSEDLSLVGARLDEDFQMLAFAFKTAVLESTQFNTAKLFLWSCALLLRGSEIYMMGEKTSETARF